MTHEVVATIKYGKGFEEPWLTFHGTPEEIRADIIEVFDLAPDTTLTLGQLTLNAASIANAMGVVSEKLNARAITEEEAKAAEPEAKPEPEPEAEAPSETPAEPERSPLYDEVENAADVDALRKVWAENRSVFDNDADLLDAWKVKGRLLQDASK